MTYFITYPGSDFSKAKVQNLLGDVDAAMDALTDDLAGFAVDTEEDLRNVPGPVMVALHNRVYPDGVITKFENKRKGAARVFPILGNLVKGDAKLAKSAQAEDTPAESTEDGDYPAVEPKNGSPAKGKKLGIGARIRELLVAGDLDSKAIVETIHKEFPLSRATVKDVSIMRAKIRDEEEEKKWEAQY